MKKFMKKLLSLAMILAALAALAVPALAADAVVSRKGNDIVIETTGSGYTDTDLFDNFKNVMPGDERTEAITIKNNVTGYDYVKLYIRAVPHDEQGNPLTYSETYENEDGKDQANAAGERDETVARSRPSSPPLPIRARSSPITSCSAPSPRGRARSSKPFSPFPRSSATSTPTALARWTGSLRSRASTTKSP